MSIHAHEMLALLKDEPLTKEQLSAKVTQQFGEDVRFHTCSLQNLTLDELLAFLLQRQKICERDHHYTLNIANICQH